MIEYITLALTIINTLLFFKILKAFAHSTSYMRNTMQEASKDLDDMIKELDAAIKKEEAKNV